MVEAHHGKDNILRVIKSTETLREKTLESIRNAILFQHFRPGQRLTERELCEGTGVSRTCVREALRHLEAEGLVVTVPHRGPTVATVSAEEAHQIYEVRRALEILACDLFIRRASPAEIRALANTVDTLEEAIAAQDLIGALKANEAFYEVIFDGSGNRIAADLSRALRARVGFLRAIVTSRWDPGRSREALALMRKVVSAIRRRDARSAKEAFAAHLDRSEAIAVATLEAQADSATKEGRSA